MKSLSLEKMEKLSGSQYSESDFACGTSLVSGAMVAAGALLFPPAAITMAALGLLFGGMWLATAGIAMSCGRN